MVSQIKNPVLSIYCRPLHSTTKHVVHCLLHCDYKNRCRDFVSHYMSHQDVIDKAVGSYQALRDKEARLAMLADVVEQPNPDALPRPPAVPRARVKEGERLPLVKPELPARPVAKARQRPRGKRPAAMSGPPRKEQERLGDLFIILESGGKAVVLEDERRVLDHLIKAKRKARYFRATELEVQLQMVPVGDRAKAKKPAAKKKAPRPQQAKNGEG